MEKNKIQVDIVFIIVTYGNQSDLVRLCNSLKNKLTDTFKIVVVNSYYDEVTYEGIKDISQQNNCDFLNIENRGYGYGNNEGIIYAKRKYEFDFLIISNPDIEIIEFDKNNLEKNKVYAPIIINNKGKNQNPFRVYRFRLLEYLKYIGFKIRFKPLIYIDIMFNKLFRFKLNNNTYSCHGSFIVFGYKVIDALPERIFNDDVFLFSEEDHLARLLDYNHISIKLIENIKVRHYEDGSVKLMDDNVFELTRESYLKYYISWKGRYNV